MAHTNVRCLLFQPTSADGNLARVIHRAVVEIEADGISGDSDIGTGIVAGELPVLGLEVRAVMLFFLRNRPNIHHHAVELHIKSRESLLRLALALVAQHRDMAVLEKKPLHLILQVCACHAPPQHLGIIRGGIVADMGSRETAGDGIIFHALVFAIFGEAVVQPFGLSLSRLLADHAADAALLALGVIGKSQTAAAVAAALGEIGMLLWKNRHLLSGVVAEDPGLRVVGASVARRLGNGRVGHGVIIAQHLLDGATAVPPVGREIELPELVGRRERGVVEGGVLGADALISGGAVLQVVAVAVGHKVVPLDGHLRGVDGVVILGIKIVCVILFVDGLHIAPEHLKRFNLAIGICQRKTDLGE